MIVEAFMLSSALGCLHAVAPPLHNWPWRQPRPPTPRAAALSMQHLFGIYTRKAQPLIMGTVAGSEQDLRSTLGGVVQLQQLLWRLRRLRGGGWAGGAQAWLRACSPHPPPFPPCTRAFPSSGAPFRPHDQHRARQHEPAGPSLGPQCRVAGRARGGGGARRRPAVLQGAPACCGGREGAGCCAARASAGC